MVSRDKVARTYRVECSEIVPPISEDNAIVPAVPSLLLPKLRARSLLGVVEHKGTPVARMGERVSV